jgi:hypothetical protein
MKKILGVIIYLATTALAIVGLLWTQNQIDLRTSIYQKNIQECERLTDDLKKQLSAVEIKDETLLGCLSDLDQINYVKRNQLKWSLLLRQVAQNIPRTIWLEKIAIQRKNYTAPLLKVANYQQLNVKYPYYNFSMLGKTVQPKSILHFNNSLDHFDYIKKSSVQNINKSNNNWQFEISGDLTKIR